MLDDVTIHLMCTECGQEHDQIVLDGSTVKICERQEVYYGRCSQCKENCKCDCKPCEDCDEKIIGIPIEEGGRFPG
uniref:Uncharacterized protein n=1 Tax=viral metagenome TaxID=1070528 RepID=A0A6M3LSW5_9ZZZZ